MVDLLDRFLEESKIATKDSRKEDKDDISVLNILINAYKNSYQMLMQSNEKIKKLESELKIKCD